MEVENDAEEIMEAAGSVSTWPQSREGLQAMFTDLVRALGRNDRATIERVEEQLDLDAERFGVAFTFDGSRQLGPGVVPGAHARLEALIAAVTALGPSATVTVTGAQGRELSDGTSHGLAPEMVSVRSFLRPQIWYHRVVVASGSRAVVFEPVAMVGGHWTWLGAPWTALSAAPATPGTPVVRAR